LSFSAGAIPLGWRNLFLTLQLRQLRDVRRDPPRLVFGQRLAEWRLTSSRLQLLGTAKPWPF
jgi:hypothetical protein